jgi:hypothetical protein
MNYGISKRATANEITAHSQLTNLDYASADHTGFAPTVHSHLYANVNCGIDETTPLAPADLSIDDENRILTIIPPLGYFNYFTDGNGAYVKHTQTGNLEFPDFDNTSGYWYFYINADGEAVATQTVWADFSTVCPILRLTWNATTQSCVSCFVEYHLNTISAIDHLWKHSIGAIWIRGLEIYHNAITSGSPNADGRNTVLGLSNGAMMDDNLLETISNTHPNSPVNKWEQNLGQTDKTGLTSSLSAILNIRYKGATEAELVTGTRFPFLWNSGNNKPQYVNTSGVKTDVSSSYFFVYYIYGIFDPRVGEAIRLTPVYSEYANLSDAQAVTWRTVQLQDQAARDLEIRPLYKLIFEYRTSYNVACKYSALRQVFDVRKEVVALSNIEI